MADRVTARTPHIVKLNDEQFVIMWEEYDSSSKQTTMKMVDVDGDGNTASEIVETKLRLSDCKPVLMADGLMRWYVTDGASTVFCEINPYDLESVTGAVEISEQSGYPGGGDDDDPWWNPWPWWNDDEDGDNDNIDDGNIDDENGGGNHVAHNPGTVIEYKRILFRVTGKIRLHARAEKSHAAQLSFRIRS